MKDLIDKYVSQEVRDKVEEHKSLILTILIVIGAVALCAAVAIVVYRIITKHMEEVAADDVDFDEDEDFFESEEE